MHWEALLSSKRVREFGKCPITPNDSSNLSDLRSPFERDVDQIIFSYPFRRLQDKTQVIPFPEFDFVHTRLTHSLEVASLGRSFGKLAYNLIREREGDSTKKFFDDSGLDGHDLSALISAACYAHDIGNPPFGHSGEDSISHYFVDTHTLKPEYLEGYPLEYLLSSDTTYKDLFDIVIQDYRYTNLVFDEFGYAVKRWFDLVKFEGNANGFRILTANCERGINPTAAVLGAFTKYPRESHLIGKINETTEKPKSQSKYGFFQSERTLFDEIAKELGLIPVSDLHETDIAYHRHPLAFLVEAADDIAYGMIDFEDGCRLNLIDLDKKYGTISIRDKKTNIQEEKNIEASPKEILSNIAMIDTAFDSERIGHENSREVLSYLRSKVINVMVHECFKVFEHNYEDIMTGKYDKSLIDDIPSTIKGEWKKMKDLIRKYVYNYQPVLRNEASGFEVMRNLIDNLGMSSGICYSCGDTPDSKQIKFGSLLPEEFHIGEMQKEELDNNDIYTRFLSILDYVSGMTDNYAINLYRQINGMVPSLR